MHNHLTFRTQPDSGLDRSGLAETIASSLRAKGVDHVEVREHPHSHILRVQVGKRHFTLILGALDDTDDPEWLLVALSQLSRLRRLFGADDTPNFIGLLRWIEETVFQDDRCHDPTWHTKEAWLESRGVANPNSTP